MKRRIANPAKLASAANTTMAKKSTQNLELVRCAYERCCGAYDTAVGVTKFTWQLFYTREAAVFGAAGFVALSYPHVAFISTLLLGLSALMTSQMTWPQMRKNQQVIRKIIAAGVDLEVRYPELGCRFKIDAFGDKLPADMPFTELWKGPQQVELRTIRDMALTPRFDQYCLILMSGDIAFALLALGYWMCYLPNLHFDPMRSSEEGLVSLAVVLCLVAFSFVAIGLANISRHRVEDLRVKRDEILASDSQSTELRISKIDSFIAHARRDFDKWHGITQLVCAGAVALFVSVAIIALAGKLVLTPIDWIAVVLGLITAIAAGVFSLLTYPKERQSLLEL